MIDLLILTFCRIDDFCIIYEKYQNLKSIGKIYTKSARGLSIEIDRLNSNKEYSLDNVVLACYWCNNAKTDEYVNMLKAGIIDPTKVARIALENAASVAGMILTTECALVDIKEEAPAGGGMPPMGGGGMPGMM